MSSISCPDCSHIHGTDRCVVRVDTYSSDGDICGCPSETEVLRGIIRQMLDGFDPSLEEGAWVKIFGSYSGPEREGHLMTNAEKIEVERAKPSHA